MLDAVINGSLFSIIVIHYNSSVEGGLGTPLATQRGDELLVAFLNF